MSPVIILAVFASVLVETQLVTGTPTGDPILIGKYYKTNHTVCMMSGTACKPRSTLRTAGCTCMTLYTCILTSVA